MRTTPDDGANRNRLSNDSLDERLPETEDRTAADERGADLRESVCEALAVLAQGFVDGESDLGRDDLDTVYEASLTYLYRLVFVLYAESDGRSLLDTDDETYRRRYSLSALKRRVAEKCDSPDFSYRASRTALWDRLDELFALVDEGSEAQGVPPDEFHVPAYSGGLFETGPDAGETAAFLDAHAVGDASLARVIDLLARRESERGDGRAFVDYSSLDVRRLGSIYEGLLEYDLDVADAPLAAVRADGRREWVPVDDADPAETVARVAPGDVYLATDADERKATGSYYTPEFVAEYAVERALDPLLDEIRSDLDPTDPDYAEAFAERVFDLSVLDPAMGSGHFLLETVEYLAGAIAAARREQAERAGADAVGDAGDGNCVADIRDGNCAADIRDGNCAADTCDGNWARRQVARRCIYGVDTDGTAVELAKMSLWLRTLADDRPLVFLDHHLERGDSLAGTDVAEVEASARGAASDADLAAFGATRADAMADLTDAYREFAASESETLADVKETERRYAEIRRDDRRRRLTAMANVHAAERFGLDVPADAYERMARAVDDADAWAAVADQSWFEAAQQVADDRDLLHWKLAFPEVFYDEEGSPKTEADAGFDAVVGNPPYVRSRNLPDDRKEYYREEFPTARGAYDLYVPFAELAGDLGRRVSLVVPNKWTTTDYGRALRDRLLDGGLREVLDASNLDVFPDADVYPVVVTYGESPSRDDGDGSEGIRIRHPERTAAADAGRALADAPTTTVSQSLVDRLGGRVIPLDLTDEFADLAEAVLARCDRLGDHVTMTEGVHTGNVREKLVVEDGDGEVDDGGDETDGRGDRTDYESDDTYRKLVGGASVGRYRLDWDGAWLRYDESPVGPGEYADLRDPDCFEGEKLLVADISDRPAAVYDDADRYALNTLYSVRSREESSLSLRYLLGVFNSAFVAAYYRQVYGGTHVSGDYLRFKPMFAERIPVPDPDAAPVGPDEVAGIAADAGVADLLGDPETTDPETAVATLTERVRTARDRRAELTLDVAEYFGRPAADPTGETLGAVGVPAKGVGDSVLAETAADRDRLRVGEVRVDEVRVEGDTADGLVLSATARYKPPDGRRNDEQTDRWGYVETDPVPAIYFPSLDEPERTLVEAFVPRAVAEGGGFAGFRGNATKTNSLLDRLRSLTLPDVERAADEVARYREARAAAEALDERISALEDAIDAVVYRLYGLDGEEFETGR